MRKLVLIAAAAAMLSFASPALAGDSNRDYGAFVGGTAGAWTGGTIGFFIGGPIGAIIGGTTGAVIGGAALSNRDDRYQSSVHGGSVQVGDHIGGDVRLRHISGEDRYGYFRANGRIYIVDIDTREVVEIRRG